MDGVTCASSDGEEELEDLPAVDKEADPLFHMKINNVISDFTFTGKVVDIEVGKLSR